MEQGGGTGDILRHPQKNNTWKNACTHTKSTPDHDVFFRVDKIFSPWMKRSKHLYEREQTKMPQVIDVFFTESKPFFQTLNTSRKGSPRQSPRKSILDSSICNPFRPFFFLTWRHRGHIKYLYHQTSRSAGPKILKHGFRSGHVGWCGGAIYFALSKGATYHKADAWRPTDAPFRSGRFF